MPKSTFEVSKRGLAKLLRKRGVAFAVIELIQNAFDEGSTEVFVALRKMDTGRKYALRVRDDNPEGFKDLSHAYTLFAESEKAANPEQRGRFNLGEKLVIAICDEASIYTTKGSVHFDTRGRRHGRQNTALGSSFEGIITMTQAEAAEVERAVKTIIIPDHITLHYNDGERIPHRTPLRTFSASLPTLKANEEGDLSPTRRQTTVAVYEPLRDEPPRIYEMGLPVVENESRFDINVGQKVPLNMNRDNVTPAYLRELRTLVLNEMADYLPDIETSEVWIDHALESEDVAPEAVDRVLTGRFGENRVVYDPSDPEANKLAVSKGYHVIGGRTFNSRQWENIRDSGAVQPAGKVTPSPKPYSDDPDAPTRQEYPREKWSEGMEQIANWTRLLGEHLMGVSLRVILINDIKVPASAVYYHGNAVIEYNVAHLGKRWFDQDPRSERVLALILHEFAHQYESDHLSGSYHHAICKLGARLGDFAYKHPDLWARAGESCVPSQ